MARIRPLALAAALVILPLPARPADAPPSQPSPAATPSPALTAAVTPTAAAHSAAAVAKMSWEGLVRRTSGLALKGRWDVGTLEFREEMLRWNDARDAGKNLLIPASKILAQYQTCAKTPAGPDCFEWGFRTKEVAYTFRDFSWEKGAHKKVAEIYEFMKAIYPSLPSSQADGKR